MGKLVYRSLRQSLATAQLPDSTCPQIPMTAIAREYVLSWAVGTAAKLAVWPVEVLGNIALAAPVPGGGGLAVMAAHKQRKFSKRGRSPAPESRQTYSAPIRATVPLIEQYYVAVDRQLKSGFGTYEAAEKPQRR
jgi:hypothetical protein